MAQLVTFGDSGTVREFKNNQNKMLPSCDLYFLKEDEICLFGNWGAYTIIIEVKVRGRCIEHRTSRILGRERLL